MSRMNLRRAVLVVAAGAAFVVAVAGGLIYSGNVIEYASRDNVDRAAYIRENRKLLVRVPRVPGATRVSVQHEATRYYADMCFLFCDTFIDGYITSVTYERPAGATTDSIIQFYRRALPPLGWRRSWVRRTGSFGWGAEPAPKVTGVGFTLGDARSSVDLVLPVESNTRVWNGQFVIHVAAHESYTG